MATQLIMQTSESGISAKSLRGRDSTRKQDASEKVRRQKWSLKHPENLSYSDIANLLQAGGVQTDVRMVVAAPV